MSKFTIKKLPPIKLVDLLKKRKTNLKQFLMTTGITTYVTLSQKCEKMGVSPPSEKDFYEIIGKATISSPQEGVVVLEPPLLLKETGEKIKLDDKEIKASAAVTDQAQSEQITASEQCTDSVENALDVFTPVKKSTKKKREVDVESQ